MPAAAAYRIHTERLVLRCYAPADAFLLKEAVDDSLEHLRPWMPWAADKPEPVERTAGLLRRMRADFDRDESYVYGVFDRDESSLVGGAGLHKRVGDGALEIGYWIRASRIGLGYATEAAAALTRVAFGAHGVDRVEIHCDPKNERSAAVARKLGYGLEVTLRRRATGIDGRPRDTMIWTLFADAFATSPSAATRIEAFDVLGRRIT